MQERENLKKYYTELLQLEFEQEVNLIMKNDKIATEKKIKEFLDKCQFTKYKSPNKPSTKNVSTAIDENTPIQDQSIGNKAYAANSARLKNSDVNVMKDITNSNQNKPGKANVASLPNGPLSQPIRAGATVYKEFFFFFNILLFLFDFILNYNSLIFFRKESLLNFYLLLKNRFQRLMRS